MTFKRLSEYFQKLEKTSSRLAMMEILGMLFKEAEVEEVDKICYLALGRLGPKYEGVEFQMAEKMGIRVLALVFEVEKAVIVKEYKKRGDLGIVASILASNGRLVNTESLKSRRASGRSEATENSLVHPIQRLSVTGVYERLLEIAREVGEGSQERKINKMAKLLQWMDSLSVKYIIRVPLGKLRLGFSDITMIDGLSFMIAGDKSLAEEIRRAYEVRADIGQIAKSIKSIRGIKSIKGIKPEVGMPVMPALCQRLGTAEEMMEKVAEPIRTLRVRKGVVAVEPKFDGTRLQVHVGCEGNGGDEGKKGVRIFTRNLENVTHMFPEIVEGVKGIKGVKGRKRGGLILDGEAVGVEPKTGKFLSFQETIKRKRKHGVQEALLRIPVVYFVFDVLYWGEGSLLDRPFSERRELLEGILGDKGDKRGKGKVIRITPQKLVDGSEELRKIHDEYIAQGLEGAVVKNWLAGYEPGRRGFTWVKFKQEETKKGGGLADTVDCLVMGYYKGMGKRAKFGIGAFLVGIMKKPKTPKDFEGYVTISKIGTGLSDEQWRKLKVKSEKLKVKDKPREYLVDKNLTPDVWVLPELVAEIEADNITKSPIHTAGLALRFPRLKKFRDDKGPGEVTTVGEVRRLYRLQFN